MIVIVFKYLIPKRFRGFTFFPFVFLKNKVDKEDVVMLNHEKIHLRQQLELLVIPFLLVYILEFLFLWFRYKKFNSAYRNISFEREAYLNEKDLDYLKQRSFWRFMKYYIS